MRIYISGPITHKPDHREIFAATANELRKAGHGVVDPTTFSPLVKEAGLSYDEILQLDLEVLRLCDAMVQLPGWKDSLGCRMEYGFALGQGIRVTTLKGLLA